MSYEKFKQNIYEKIKSMLPSDTHIELNNIIKNNDVILDTLSITSSTDNNIAVQIYLKEHYTTYEATHNLDEVCKDILKLYEYSKTYENIDISSFTDYELSKEHLCCKVVNYERNKKMLKLFHM